ncbi:hypothetical protein KM043_018840 [Ampulex compressa]|nr:hypothetical protein KM043_018840 [Ampulex compressa]
MPKILAGKIEKRKIKSKKKAEPAAEMPEETMTEFPASDEEDDSLESSETEGEESRKPSRKIAPKQAREEGSRTSESEKTATEEPKPAPRGQPSGKKIEESLPSPKDRAERTRTTAATKEKTVELEGLRQESADIIKEALHFCLGKGKEIGKAEVAFLMGKFTSLHEIIGGLVLRCCRLEGRIYEKERKECSGISATVHRKDTQTVQKNAPQTFERRPQSFADAARAGIKNAPQQAATVPVATRRITTVIHKSQQAPARNEILIRPADEEKFATSEATKKAIMSIINAATEKIGIKSGRMTRDKGVIIEAIKPEHIKVFTSNGRLQEAGLVASRPTGERPRLIVYDVLSDLKESEVTRSIAAQNSLNLQEDEAAQHMRALFKTGERGKDTVNWVLEVAPEIRRKILAKERVNIGWMSCKVRNHLQVSRCFKCQSYGHIAKHCKAAEEICKQCSKSGHRGTDCPETDKKAVCINCKKSHREFHHKAGRSRTSESEKTATEEPKPAARGQPSGKKIEESLPSPKDRAERTRTTAATKEKTVELEGLRQESADIIKEALHFCLGKGKEIGKAEVAFLMGKLTSLHEIIGGLVLRCGRLEGRIYEKEQKECSGISATGVIIEAIKPEHIKVFTSNGRLQEAGLVASRPTGERPRLIVYDVPSDLKESEVTRSIAAQNSLNLQEDEAAQHMRALFKTGERGKDTVNWVLEVAPEIRRKILAKERVNIGWMSCKVRDHLQVSRCFKCQSYGHIAKHCKAAEEICKQCSKSGHRGTDCPEADKKAVCINCKKSHREFHHKAGSKKCPSHVAALERKAANIHYG